MTEADKANRTITRRRAITGGAIALGGLALPGARPAAQGESGAITVAKSIHQEETSRPARNVFTRHSSTASSSLLSPEDARLRFTAKSVAPSLFSPAILLAETLNSCPTAGSFRPGASSRGRKAFIQSPGLS
jgi:hypothetical protein